MKKLSILMLALIALFSCKKSNNNVADDLQQYNYNLKRLTGVVGKLHNEGVARALLIKNKGLSIPKIQSLFPVSPETPTTPQPVGAYSAQDVRNIIASSYDYVLSQPEFSGSERGIPAQVIPSVISTIYAPDPVTINLKVDSTVTSLRQQNLVSIREAGMIQELQDIFINGYALNMTQANAGVYFANKLNELRAKYVNIVWEINEGEGFLGMLEIATSSNQYWHANTTQPAIASIGKSPQAKLMSINKTMNLLVPPATPLEPETPIVQVDLAAYALSWGWSVWNEYQAGTLNSSGQWNRISKGLQVAISASTLRLVKSSSALITIELFQEAGVTPGGGGEGGNAPVLLFPEPLTEAVYYTNQYTHIGSNHRPPFLMTSIYKQGNLYYYDPNHIHTLPDGYYILQDDLSENKYYQVAGGRVIKIDIADNDPNAPLAPYDTYNPFGTILIN
ncbi:hypothetical protein J7E50_20100 [Pedobacter sp. ISL-68]|uniref:hypothetical protein n=1 Tax=unclassified Pedobacter TaxID=2628915 RepID=UPI001BEB8469|nr:MULTISPECIES: hypothetical protein [unclassified Pedobacter]MBT2561872.1 hypothetical protein [Pedobacter sp. ISL-64]MBT2592530.1 hypothetical protein [Pedobacter sp. ISL-68]